MLQTINSLSLSFSFDTGFWPSLVGDGEATTKPREAYSPFPSAYYRQHWFPLLRLRYHERLRRTAIIPTLLSCCVCTSFFLDNENRPSTPSGRTSYTRNTKTRLMMQSDAVCRFSGKHSRNELDLIFSFTRPVFIPLQDHATGPYSVSLCAFAFWSYHYCHGRRGGALYRRCCETDCS